MRTLRMASLVLAGLVAGIALVIACDGNGPGATDAAESAEGGGDCNCPVQEPIEGRLRQYSNTVEILSTDDQKSVIASCQTSEAIVLSGYCWTAATGGERVFLKNFFGTTAAWSCSWQNPEHIGPIEITATALCLMPPGTPDAGP